MHKSLKNISLAGFAATLILTPAMLAAQEEPGTDTAQEEMGEAAAPAAGMTPDQEAAMQTWPADKQSAFRLWPTDTQAYFWSLAQERQEMFWALSDTDKVALSQMDEPQRESVWAQIESRSAPPQG